jgi:hypothetical protein
MQLKFCSDCSFVRLGSPACLLVRALWEKCGHLVGEVIFRSDRLYGVVMSACLGGRSDLR